MVLSLGCWGLLIAGVTTNDQLLITLGVLCFAGTAARLLAMKWKASNRDKQERLRIWRQGRAAIARVVSIGTRGGGINDHPMIDFELDVFVDGSSAYRVSTRQLISKLAIPRVQPDCEIAVRVDPHARELLVVDAALTPYGYE